MTEHPYGWWPSPLSAADAAASRTAPVLPQSAGPWLYWAEARPAERGRVVVRRARVGGAPEDVTPDGLDVRSRVHEYGGGAFCVLPDGRGVVAVDAGDQRLYRVDRPGGPAVALSPEAPAGERWCHGDLRAAPDGTWVVAVRERHRADAVRRDVVRYGTGGPGDPGVLAAGRDFYAAPRPSPDTERLAYVAWDHPDMPWDSSEVWVQERGGAEPVRVAGGGGDSVGQPGWSADGALRFVCDREGWWQPWVWRPGAAARRTCAVAAEFHGPDWVLGQVSMAEVAPGTVCCRVRRDGLDALALLDEASGALRPVAQPCVSIGAVVAHDGGVAVLGRTPEAPAALWWGPWAAAGGTRPVGPFAPLLGAAAPGGPLAPADMSVAEPFSAQAPDGREVTGLFYAPRRGGVTAPARERPPLVVFCHSGPTGSVEAGFDVVVQFFTTRGFAVAGVDYAGSTGHGRAFRRSLFGRWGEVDAADCVAAARHLAGTGVVDGRRMAVRGTSAGGFTALNALAGAPCFAAAAAWYPVTDLLALEGGTHDFESRSHHRLVGPLPEAAERYRRRSPVHRAAEMSGAVLLCYGLDDPVVPPSQAQALAAALRAAGVDCEERAFAGEGHGFRQAATVEAALRAEVAFYRRTVVGGAPPPGAAGGPDR